MTRCNRCLMPDTRPDTVFVDGVCSACLSHDARENIDWGARLQELHALREHLEPVYRQTGYHCIVPSSGGKDSTFQVITLIKAGFRPLVVTATTCHLTAVGRANIDNLSRYATTIEVTPNREARKKLNRLGLEMVGDISWPEHVSIFTTPFRIASQTGIKALFYGENPQNQYGGPMGTENARHLTRRWRSEFGGFLGLRPQDIVGSLGVTDADMRDYQMPDDVEDKGIEAHFLGYYLLWDSHHNTEVARMAGMVYKKPGPMNLWAAENQDNFQTGIHDFFCYLKYGYGRLCAQISVDIRDGLVDRHTAYNIVRNQDGLFPDPYCDRSLHAILGHIDMDEDEFIRICNVYMNKDLFVEDRIEWRQTPTLKEFHAPG